MSSPHFRATRILESNCKMHAWTGNSELAKSGYTFLLLSLGKKFWQCMYVQIYGKAEAVEVNKSDVCGLIDFGCLRLVSAVSDSMSNLNGGRALE